MDKEAIVQLMAEAGLKPPARGDFIFIHWDQIARLIAHEREKCAMVCEELPAPDIYDDSDKSMWDVTTMDCAEAIRNRGT